VCDEIVARVEIKRQAKLASDRGGDLSIAHALEDLYPPVRQRGPAPCGCGLR